MKEIIKKLGMYQKYITVQMYKNIVKLMTLFGGTNLRNYWFELKKYVNVSNIDIFFATYQERTSRYDQ